MYLLILFTYSNYVTINKGLITTYTGLLLFWFIWDLSRAYCSHLQHTAQMNLDWTLIQGLYLCLPSFCHVGNHRWTDFDYCFRYCSLWCLLPLQMHHRVTNKSYQNQAICDSIYLPGSMEADLEKTSSINLSEDID